MSVIQYQNPTSQTAILDSVVTSGSGTSEVRREIVVERGAGLNPGNPTNASVGISSGSALAANANRTGLVVVNTSSNTVSFGLGVAAVLNNGITLNPNGGTWVMDAYTFTTAQIFAIASAGSSNISIQEYS